MALKDRLCRRRMKRLTNVSENVRLKCEEMPSSSDSDDEALRNKKVREGYSFKNSLKHKDTVNDGDHIYNCGKSRNGQYFGVRKTKNPMKRKNSEENDAESGKRRCISRNAVNARLNRERKKLYVSSLESENEGLRKENSDINQKIEIQNKTILLLKREITYLKGLLANSKELGQILQNLRTATGLPVTSSMTVKAEEEMKDTELSDDGLSTKNEETYHAKVRSVNCGSNFPILFKDVNLGSCSDRTLSLNDVPYYENPCDFENNMPKNTHSCFNTEIPHEDCIFDFDSNWDLDMIDLNQSNDSDVSSQSGICLHVNQSRISVEICSICNNKAKTTLIGH